MPVNIDPGQWAAQNAFQYQNAQNQNAQNIANTQAGASRYGSDAQLKGSLAQTAADVQNANTAAAAQKYGYGTQLQGTQYSSDASKASALGVANANLAGTRYSSDASKAAQEYAAQQAADASTYGAQLGLQGTQYSSDAAKAAQEYAASQAAGASRYGADQQLAGVNANVAGQNQRFGQSLAFDQSKFNDIFGYIQGQTGGLGGTSRGGTAHGGVDFNAGAPQISTSPVFTPGQIQANVNNAVGLIDQRTGGQNAALARQAAARGVGSQNSPLVRALMAQNNAIGTGQAANAELNFRSGAAQSNAQQTLSAQQAAAQAYNQNSALGVQQQGNLLNYNSALIAALAGMAGGSPTTG